jgi:hypothetical protein
MDVGIVTGGGIAMHAGIVTGTGAGSAIVERVATDLTRGRAIGGGTRGDIQRNPLVDCGSSAAATLNAAVC